MSEVVRRVPSQYNKNINTQKQQKKTKIINRRSWRSHSISGLEGLIQCGICMQELSSPRMLECQHTFCHACLKTTFLDQSTMVTRQDGHLEVATTKKNEIKCPTCSLETSLKNGVNSLDKLPGNVYIDSLLKLVKGQDSTTEIRCVKCQTVSGNKTHEICQHCSQFYCTICWKGHMDELNTILINSKSQLNDINNKLDKKIHNFQDHCEQMKEAVQRSIEEKVIYLMARQEDLMDELETFKNNAYDMADKLRSKLKNIENKIQKQSTDVSFKVNSFLDCHKLTSSLLNEVNNFGESRVIYDSEGYKLDLCNEGIYNDMDESEVIGTPIEPAAKQYKLRTFDPILKWSRCPRPAGIGIPVWDKSKLYIAAPDNKFVMIMNRESTKLIGKLINENMEFPCAVAFSNKTNEVYVSDKWKHCIHVFSRGGDYLRMICTNNLKFPSGILVTANNSLVIADTGNNRIVIVNARSGKEISEITGLNNPTGIAQYGDNILVADTGNHRIKTFDLHGNIINQFGSLGKNPGQLRCAEAITVDHLGFILVGDGGNARIQVFKPDGSVLKIYCNKESFGWVSGLIVTPEFEIIMTDHKERNLIIF